MWPMGRQQQGQHSLAVGPILCTMPSPALKAMGKQMHIVDAPSPLMRMRKHPREPRNTCS